MNNRFPTIQSSRLLLRQFSNSDIENVFKGLSHPMVIQYYGVSYATLEDTKAQMIFFKELEQNNTGTWWAICSLDNTVFYGAIGINSINHTHHKGEMGYWLLPQYWGQGIISEAAPPVVEYAFNYFDLHRIEAVVETGNESSKKLLNKIGFAYEGTMKECEVKNGRYISLDMYASIKPGNPPR